MCGLSLDGTTVFSLALLQKLSQRTCFIIVRTDTVEEFQVSERLKHGFLIAPFRILPSNMDNPKLVFQSSDAMSPTSDTDHVYAEIQIINPEECNMAVRCISWDGQAPPVCPVTMQPFTTGDAIFIFQCEFHALITQDDPVHCVSALGLRRILADEKTIREGGFADPYNVFKHKLMRRKDYVGLIMMGGTNNTDICQVHGTPLSEIGSDKDDPSDSDSDGLIFESNDEPILEENKDYPSISHIEVSASPFYKHHFINFIVFIFLFTLFSTSFSSNNFYNQTLSVEFLSSTPFHYENI